MAQYKVPQDVEADDKLIGPFSFRQFVYLIITAALGGVGFLLFRIFPLLVIIPIPFMLFFIVLALPLKKDQPMETYLSAVVSFYMKPRKRLWAPGQGETTIVITAPKQTDEVRTKGLSEEEATHRLSFLADIVDTEGYAIKNGDTAPVRNSLRDDFYQENNDTQDMFELAAANGNISHAIDNNEQTRHEQLVAQMRAAIDSSHNIQGGTATPPTITHQVVPAPAAQAASAATVTAAPAPSTPTPTPSTAPAVVPQAATAPVLPPNPLDAKDGSTSSVIIQPGLPPEPEPVQAPEPSPEPLPQPEVDIDVNTDDAVSQEGTTEPDQALLNLAHDQDLSIETIAKQAKRLEEKQDNDEVYISLH